jgi:hypothetical protein
MIPAVTATTVTMMPITKPAFEECLAEPWPDVDVAVEDVDVDVEVDVGLPPYGQ